MTVTFLNVAELLKRPGIRWLIKGVLPAHGTATLVGEPGGGKTFLVLDLAGAVMRGVPWFGHRVKRPGDVVYICGEGEGGLPVRLQAYQSEYPDVNFIEQLHILPRVNLLDDDAIEPIGLAIRERFPKTSLIIIDTLNATMRGGDENASKDMSCYIDNLHRLGNLAKAFVLVVHHLGKDTSRGPRGHSSLRADNDGLLIVAPQEAESNDEPGKKLTIRKVREGRDNITYEFDLRVIQLGRDEDGDPITSCVIDPYVSL